MASFGSRGQRWLDRHGQGWTCVPATRSLWLLCSTVGWLDIQGQTQQWEHDLPHSQK